MNGSKDGNESIPLDKKSQFQLRIEFEKNRSASFPSSYPWYSRLDYRILIGGMPDADMVVDLINTENVGGALGLATSEEIAWGDSLDLGTYSRFDIKYLHKPVGNVSEMTVDLLKECLEFIQVILGKQRAVYIFSADGRTRSCIVGICHLIRTYRMPTVDAIDELKNIRPHAQIDDTAYRCCKQFAKAEKATYKNSDAVVLRKPPGPVPADPSRPQNT